jgi:hypothetical protein
VDSKRVRLLGFQLSKL